MRFLKEMAILPGLCDVPRFADEPEDDAFYLRYYGGTKIPPSIPIRVRRVCVEQCGRRWLAVEPEDVPVDDELDLDDLLQEIGEEFGMAIPSADQDRLSTFDSIVRYVAGQEQDREG